MSYATIIDGMWYVFPSLRELLAKASPLRSGDALAGSRQKGDRAGGGAQANPNGGAIALGHPLGMSGARLVATAAYELRRRGERYAPACTTCIGVGQGIAMSIERV
jgi:acetyl-CoA acyltransferase